MKKILFLLLFLWFLNQSYASINKFSEKFVGCNNSINENYLQNFDKIKIKKIEIETHKYRKWVENNINIITSHSRFISDIFKRKFDSTIVVTYENNSKCVLLGRMRQSGDAKDHIALKGNSIIQSLDVHLTNGNIRGITKFKLFKPDTRGVLEDVVIQTELLRQLDYLAPRSIKVATRVNETESIMLFQEKAAKELLEHNKRREGPILEGDQKFFFKLVESIPQNQLSNWSVETPILRSKSIKAMLAKQTNAKLIHRSEIHKDISYKSLNDLNLIYLYYSNRFEDEKNNYYFFDYDLDNTLLGFFDEAKIKKLDIYNLLMQSTNSHHALSASNRKFYWNSIENYFEPINYDSNPDIDKEDPTTTTTKHRFPISDNYLESFNSLEGALNNINFNIFYQNILNSGVNIDRSDLKKKINKIILNLNKIKQSYLQDVHSNTEIIEHNKFKNIDKILDNFYSTLTEIDRSAYLIKHSSDSKLQRCKIYLKNCENFNLSEKNLAELLEGDLIIENKTYQYLGKSFNFKNFAKYQNYNKQKFRNSFIYYDSGTELKIENKNIFINQSKPGSRIFIKGGNLFDINIIFKSLKNREVKKLPLNFPIDHIGLTGCLSIINAEFKNLSIVADGSTCEDTINIINSRGHIKEINIKNSFRDALDVDFSNLEIDNINIDYALNDCVDFSAGFYKLNNLILNNCGDKAISIGEKSLVSLDKISSNKSNVGLASKDSSITKINFANFSNLNICATAYKKKQEFKGGFIEINNLKCENYYKKYEVDSYSKIIEKKQL